MENLRPIDLYLKTKPPQTYIHKPICHWWFYAEISEFFTQFRCDNSSGISEQIKVWITVSEFRGQSKIKFFIC